MISLFKPQAPRPHFELLTRDVAVKGIHSHNDYWRRTPLLDALGNGCASVESDIWLFPKTDTISTLPSFASDDTLYVGHNEMLLKRRDTLDALYLDPLYRLLEQLNAANPLDYRASVYYDSPETPTFLWFDIKTEANATYRVLQSYLERFDDKGYLARWDTKEKKVVHGPVLVTLTGNVPWALLDEERLQKPHTNVFYDGPLHKFGDSTPLQMRYYSERSVIASASLLQLLGAGDWDRRPLNDAERTKLKRAFDKAHEYGIKTRIWGNVEWPTYVRDAHWRALWELGVDLLNTDAIGEASYF